MSTRKVLWVIDASDVDGLVSRAIGCGVSAVCVRTSATNFASLIPALNQNAVDVLGWRYPPTDPQSAHHQAVDAAAIVALGLDGFIVDPEGDPSSSLFNWDRPGLADIAEDYCSTIRHANPSMHFGTTSHYLAGKPFPQLPWAAFLKYSDAVYPQAYWRAQTQHGPISIGTSPAENYAASLAAWAAVGGQAGKTFPMAGELGVASPAEIQQYAAAAATHGVTELHFYVHGPGVDPSVWNAIAQA